MAQIARILVATLMLLSLGVRGHAGDCSRLAPEELTYLGSFMIPPGSYLDGPCDRQDYGLGVIAYQPGNQIFVGSHAHDPRCVGLFGIPADLSGGKNASVLKRRWGVVPKITTTTQATYVQGLEWDDTRQRLCWTRNMYYNVSNQDFADVGCIDEAGGVFGPWEVGFNNKIAGPMAVVGDAKYLIGLTGVPGAGSSNFGPAAYELDLTPGPPPSVVPLMEHGSDTREVMSDGTPWRTSMPAFGSAVIDGTLLWSVDQGERTFYGSGEQFEATYGFKPRTQAKGYHHDRYTPTLYFYALSELERTRAGEIATTDVHPYAYLSLTPDVPQQAWLGEMTLDTAGRRLFLARQRFSAGLQVYVYGY